MIDNLIFRHNISLNIDSRHKKHNPCYRLQSYVIKAFTKHFKGRIPEVQLSSHERMLWPLYQNVTFDWATKKILKVFEQIENIRFLV